MFCQVDLESLNPDRDVSIILLFQSCQPVYLIKLVCASLTLVCSSIIIYRCNFINTVFDSGLRQ